MRKSITLCPKLEYVVSNLSKITHISESAIINFAIYQTCCIFNEEQEELFFDKVSDFYYSYYIKQLPRGKVARRSDNETKTKKI